MTSHIIGLNSDLLSGFQGGLMSKSYKKALSPWGSTLTTEVGLGGYIRSHLPPKDSPSHGFSVISAPKHPAWLSRYSCWTTNWWWFCLLLLLLCVRTQAIVKQSHVTLSWFPSFPASSSLFLHFPRPGIATPKQHICTEALSQLWFLRCCLRHRALLGTSSHNAT